MTNPIVPGDPVVEVDGLTFSYGSGQVLHGISFAVRPGEVVGLLGPNGAGKSTTIKILTGILAPGGGSVRVAGCAMPEQATEAKKRLGYVPEAAGSSRASRARSSWSSSGDSRKSPRIGCRDASTAS